MEPLTPIRKAPSEPPLRGTSDTQLHLIEQLKGRNESTNSKDSASLKSGPDKYADRFRGTRPQFFTPQPTRHKVNLVDQTPSFNDSSPVSPVARLALKTKRHTSQTNSDSGHIPDQSPSPSPHTPVSPLAVPALKNKKKTSSESGHSTHSALSPIPNTPVSLLAVPAFKIKKLASESSSNFGLSTDMSSSASPHTPLSPLAASAFSGRIMKQSARPTLPLPDKDTKKQWTAPEKSHDGTKEAAVTRDDIGRDKEEVTRRRTDNVLGDELIRRKSGVDKPDIAAQSLNSGTKPSSRRFVSEDNGSVYSDYPSTFSASPTPSPTRQRPKLSSGRMRSSRTPLGSLKNMLASNEFLNDIFLSDRKSHRKLKGVVGALAGLVLGGCLFLGVHYGLEYGLVASIVIASVGTLMMCLSLAFTVRARCVAALMVPTLSTSEGRATFLAVVVTLLLTGPIDNIYTNAKVVSDSMGCSAELAQNQTKLIKDVAREIFDVYVRNLMQSVRKIQKAADAVHDAFRPVEDALSEFEVQVGTAGDVLRAVTNMCEELIQEAYQYCIRGVNDAYNKCKRNTGGGFPQIGSQTTGQTCNLINIADEVCEHLATSDNICNTPTLLDNLINTAFRDTQEALENLLRVFDTDVDFSAYWENRSNQSQSIDSIQSAIQQELEESFSFLNSVFSVVDKIVTLSVVFVLFRSYHYHSQYRTNDRFDNFYVTEEFKLLDEKRKMTGRDPLLPLKKSERRRLIDLSSPWLSKPEKGLFRLGLATVLLHAVIAAVLILADYGLFWLLSLISRHGQVEFVISGGGGTNLTIGGSGILSQLIQSFFVEGFAAASEFNISLDTDYCLPRPVPPNEVLSVRIGVLYVIALFMVLSQAYALRLRRRIASYFYPERELERIHFLYNTTLQKRQSLFKLLKQTTMQAKHEMDVKRRASFVAYLSAKYSCWKRVFRLLGQEKRACLGCADLDNGTFKSCGNPDCSGLYCRECLDEIGNTCSLCQENVERSDLSRGVVEHMV